MKEIAAIILIIVCGCQSISTDESRPSNILLLISDDQGWTDYGFMGHPYIRTPNLDRLAQESLTFTRGYATAPICAPSLASMITGMYPHQHGFTGNDPSFESAEERMTGQWLVERNELMEKMEIFQNQKFFTDYLSEANYLSFQTGKWWLGSWQDGKFSDGMTHGDGLRGGRHGDEGLIVGREDLQPVYTFGGKLEMKPVGRNGLQPIYDFIETAVDADRPFLVWYAPLLPHDPHTPPKELEEKYLKVAPTPTIDRYWAMCEWFDQTCGDLLDFIDKQQLSHETLILYVCDNGWAQQPDSGGWARRSKQSPYEMGIRSPLMIRWPGKIQPAADTTSLVSTIDILPTILSACGLARDDVLPGLNLLDEEAVNSRKTIFSEAYAETFDPAQPTKSLQYRIALSFPWKLILPDTINMVGKPVNRYGFAKSTRVELFNLAEDPHEQRNMAEMRPEIVTRMKSEIDNWWVPDHYTSQPPGSNSNGE